jgi:class 3 adenylate cyclase/tetratricopeptide (TPR) repeat protein
MSTHRSRDPQRQGNSGSGWTPRTSRSRFPSSLTSVTERVDEESTPEAPEPEWGRPQIARPDARSASPHLQLTRAGNRRRESMRATCRSCGTANPSTMRFCGGCGRPLDDGSVQARPSESRDVAQVQRRHVTVMFCDLVGSTPLAESLDPEDLREVILSYQQACARAVERYEGHTAKYLGDGIVVYFGYPRAHEDDAQRAVHAGLGILDELAALNLRLGERLDAELHVRIGVHTGLVVAGEMGGGATREELAIVGETPNIAARLESSAAPDTLVISDATRALVEGSFDMESMGELPLKGVSRPVGVHRVVRATGGAERLDATPRRHAQAMVGRERELEVLLDCWRGVRGGTGAIVHVSGEAGIGKSRLVRAVRDRLGHEVGAVRVWHCSAHHRNSALYPVVTHLERSLGIDAANRGAVGPAALEAAAVRAGLDAAASVPLIAPLLDVPGTSHSVLAPREARAATMAMLEALVVSNPDQGPMMLVVEDLHWADPTTVELLGRIVARIPDSPVLAIFTFRAPFEPPWNSGGGIVEVPLRPLTSGEVVAMVAAVSSTAADDDLAARVVAAADGVPLFVEEVIKMLGGPDASPGAPAPLQARPVVVPATLRSLLTERLDRLPDLRELIDAAAVLGREVSRDVLDGLVPMGPAELDAALAALIAEDVLRRVVDGAGTRYEFSHALLQEAAYESLVRRRRQALHLQVAEVLAERFMAGTEREPEVVAHHYACGDAPLKSLDYWHAAGVRALEGAAFLEAADHFARAVEALDASGAPDRDSDRAEFLSHLAAALQAGRGYAAPGVDDAYSRARSASTRTGRDDRLVSVIRGQWMLHLLRAEYTTAFELAHEVLSLCARRDDAECLADGYLYRGMVYMYRGQLEEARHDLEEAIERYRRPDRSDQVYEAQGDTGVGALAYLPPVLWNLGLTDDALVRSDQSLALADRVGGPVTLAQAWGMRSLFHLDRNDAAELFYWAEKTRTFSADRSIPYWKNLSELIVGWLRGRGGELGAGIADMEAGIEAYRDAGNRLGLPLFHMLLADLRRIAGDLGRALDELAIGEAHIAATGERFSDVALLLAKGRALMSFAEPDVQGAGAAFAGALEAARNQGARLLQLRAATQLTWHQRSVGESCTAINDIAELSDWFPASSDLADVTAARAIATEAAFPP